MTVIIFDDDLTNKEKEAIKQMDKAMKVLSKRHWFFAASGDLCLMRCTNDETNGMLSSGSVDVQYHVANIGGGCRIDGGDW